MSTCWRKCTKLFSIDRSLKILVINYFSIDGDDIIQPIIFHRVNIIFMSYPYAGSWYENNDSRVSLISSKLLVRGEAYDQEGLKTFVNVMEVSSMNSILFFLHCSIGL